MSDRHDVEALRASFQSLADETSADCSAEDLAAVWSAVCGELDPEARRALIDRLGAEPALAEAWRIAQALESSDTPASLPATSDDRPATPRRLSWPAPWLAAAAVLVLGVSAVLVPRLRDAEPVLRQPDVYAVESLLAPDIAVPREAFELRWTPGPAGSRYRVTVTTDDLRVLTIASDLEAPVLRVPVDAFAGVTSGATVFWQVDVTLPANARLSSRTFVARVQ